MNRVRYSVLNINSRLIKFLAVGFINTIFGYGVYYFGLLMGLHYGLAISIATILGVLFNFKSIGSLVFKSKDNSRLCKFIFVYILIYCLNFFGIWFLLFWGVREAISGALLLLPLAILSYYLNSRFVF